MFFLVLVGGFGSIESPNWQDKIIMYIYIYIYIHAYIHIFLFVCLRIPGHCLVRVYMTSSTSCQNQENNDERVEVCMDLSYHIFCYPTKSMLPLEH